MRELEIKPDLLQKLVKLSKKNKTLYSQVVKKIDEILISEIHYKNLRYDMNDFKRVHIGHFVLVFRYVDNKVIFEDFEHHDNIYK